MFTKNLARLFGYIERKFWLDLLYFAGEKPLRIAFYGVVRIFSFHFISHIYYVHNTISKICLATQSLQGVLSLRNAFLRVVLRRNHNIQYAHRSGTYARLSNAIHCFCTFYTQVNLAHPYFLLHFRYVHMLGSYIKLDTMRFKDSGFGPASNVKVIVIKYYV